MPLLVWFFVLCVLIDKKEMYIQYEAHTVYFAYVKYDVISYMTSPCRAEEDRLDLL